MADYLSEQEQWEAIKAWWKENGRLIVTVVILVSVAIIGFRYWQNTIRERDEAASFLYDQLLDNAFSVQSSTAALTKIAVDLEENYTKTPYASDAALFEAKAAVDKGDLKTAQTKLDWVIAHAKDSNIRQIARLRAARILFAQQRFDQAIELLATVDNDSYLPAVNLIMGDIYLAKGDKALARKSYLNALNGLPEAQPTRQYLQMQIDQLSESL